MNLHGASHPFLFVRADDRDRILAKVARYGWAQRAHEQVVASARKALTGLPGVPDRGGRHDYCYVCPACSVSLERLGDREHRCPKCGKRLSGEPYDSVTLKGVHYRLGRAARTLGLAHYLTGERAFAQKAKEVLLDYAGRYEAYPLIQVHDRVEAPNAARVFDQTLDEAVWLVDVAWGYDLIAGDLSDRDREVIEAGLLRPSAGCVKKHDAGKSNWQSWHNAGVMAVGLAVRDAALADWAIHGGSGFLHQMRESVTADGLWYEGSASYHFYALTALIDLTEAARASGIDLYGNDAYERMFTGPMRLLTPDGVSPAFHDALPMRLPSAPYEVAYARWGRREFAWVIGQGDRATPEALLFGKEEVESAARIEQTSALLPDLGFAVLRSGRGDGATYVALDYGPHGGGHGHCDKLNIVTHAWGREMAPDLGRGWPYNVPEHVDYYKLSTSHNTVTVDERTQAECAGRLLYFEDRGVAQMVGARVNDAYPGVLLERHLALTEDYLLDLFRCAAGEGERTYDWIYRNDGAFRSPARFEPVEGPVSSARGYGYFRGARRAETMGPVVGSWETDGAGLTLTVRADGWVTAFSADSAGNPVSKSLPALIVRRRGPSALFAAVHRYGPERPQAALNVDLEVQKSSVQLRVYGADVPWLDLWQVRFRGGPKVRYERIEGGQASQGCEVT